MKYRSLNGEIESKTCQCHKKTKEIKTKKN